MPQAAEVAALADPAIQVRLGSERIAASLRRNKKSTRAALRPHACLRGTSLDPLRSDRASRAMLPWMLAGPGNVKFTRAEISASGCSTNREDECRQRTPRRTFGAFTCIIIVLVVCRCVRGAVVAA